MPRRGDRRIAIRSNINNISKGFSISNESANIKRTLSFRPASHSSTNRITWLSSGFILFSIIISAIVFNSLFTSLKTLLDPMHFIIITGPSIFRIIITTVLVLFFSFLYDRLLKVKMSVAVYTLLLSFTVSIPILIIDRIVYVIIPRPHLSVHDTIFNILPLIVMPIISHFIVRANLDSVLEPPEDERQALIRQLVLMLGHTLCAILFYLILIHPVMAIEYFRYSASV